MQGRDLRRVLFKLIMADEAASNTTVNSCRERGFETRVLHMRQDNICVTMIECYPCAGPAGGFHDRTMGRSPPYFIAAVTYSSLPFKTYIHLYIYTHTHIKA